MRFSRKSVSPTIQYPPSVATYEDLVDITDVKSGTYYSVDDTGYLYSWNGTTSEWQRASFSLNSDDPLTSFITDIIEEKTSSMIELHGAFDPTNGFPTSGGSGVDGAIKKNDAWQVDGLADGATIAIDGHPLKNGMVIYANVDDPGQTGSKWNNWLTIKELGFDNIFYIHPTKGIDSSATGDTHSPYKTLSAALAAHGTSSAHTLFVLMGHITENIVLDVAGQNNLILGYRAVPDSQHTTITGNHKFAHSSITRIRFKDIVAKGAVGVDDYVFTFNGTAGRHYMENVTVIPDAAAAGKDILFTGAESRWHEFYGCYLGGKVNCESSVATMDVKITRQLAGEFELNMVNACTVKLLETQRCKKINHDAGTLIVQNLYESWNTEDEDMITSSADTGLLQLIGVTFRDIDGNWKRINKTGDCDYVLGNNIEVSAKHILAGTMLNNQSIHSETVSVTANDWVEEDASVYSITITKLTGEGKVHKLAGITKVEVYILDDTTLVPVDAYVQIENDGSVYIQSNDDFAGKIVLIGY